jgi:hypothetical protein
MTTAALISSFDQLIKKTDFVLLHHQKVALADLCGKLSHKDNSEAINALEGVLNFLDSIQDLTEKLDLVPEQYIHPDPDKTLVRWPDSQLLMEHPEFKGKAELIQDDYGLERYGTVAYWVSNELMKGNY